jgi:hypothetical protein
MSAKLLLRAAAICVLVHFLGHLFGHSSWRDGTDPVHQRVVAEMTDHAFPFMGATRSLADYYSGYSLLLCFVYAAAAVSLWMAASRVDRTLVWPVALMLLAFGVVEFLHFFPFAAAMSGLAGVLACAALVRGR